VTPGDTAVIGPDRGVISQNWRGDPGKRHPESERPGDLKIVKASHFLVTGAGGAV
jgi:hypothetical protein